jgi:presenilin-like A22 family membrane protease
MNLNQLQSKDELLKSDQEAVATTANSNTVLLVFAFIIGYAGMVILIKRKDNEMNTSIWVFIVMITVFAGFLIGYSISAQTGIHPAGTGQAEVGASGYGK